MKRKSQTNTSREERDRSGKRGDSAHETAVTRYHSEGDLCIWLSLKEISRIPREKKSKGGGKIKRKRRVPKTTKKSGKSKR